MHPENGFEFHIVPDSSVGIQRPAFMPLLRPSTQPSTNLTMGHKIWLNTTHQEGYRPSLEKPINPELSVCKLTSVSKHTLAKSVIDYGGFCEAIFSISYTVIRKLHNNCPGVYICTFFECFIKLKKVMKGRKLANRRFGNAVGTCGAFIKLRNREVMFYGNCFESARGVFWDQFPWYSSPAPCSMYVGPSTRATRFFLQLPELFNMYRPVFLGINFPGCKTSPKWKYLCVGCVIRISIFP